MYIYIYKILFYILHACNFCLLLVPSDDDFIKSYLKRLSSLELFSCFIYKLLKSHNIKITYIFNDFTVSTLIQYKYILIMVLYSVWMEATADRLWLLPITFPSYGCRSAIVYLTIFLEVYQFIIASYKCSVSFIIYGLFGLNV